MSRIIPFFITESQLVKALRGKDARAQKTVYETYAGRMMAVCVRYVSKRADAEEVMIDGFMRVYKKIDQFREEGSFEGWMRRIMVTESLLFLRRNKILQKETPLDELSGESEYQWATETVGAEELLYLISQLPDGYRTVFNLYAIDGYSHAEIAALLGITEGTSKSQLSRGRSLLQQGVKNIQTSNVVKNKGYGKTAS